VGRVVVSWQERGPYEPALGRHLRIVHADFRDLNIPVYERDTRLQVLERIDAEVGRLIATERQKRARGEPLRECRPVNPSSAAVFRCTCGHLCPVGGTCPGCEHSYALDT
jgi:hypothetical protein